MSATTRTQGAPAVTDAPRRGMKKDRTYHWIVVPMVVAFAAFHTFPVLTGVFYSFTNYAGFGPWKFVGFANFISLFKDDRVLAAYGFSFMFAIFATVLTNAISLAIALALNAKIRFRNFFRGVFFIPYVLAMLIIGYVFKFIFSTSLPRMLSGIPLFADNILTNSTWAWTTIVLLAVWQSCAFAIILYLAGLQTIPEELYEAASLDGASPAQQFRSITFPMIWSYFTINVVLSVKGFLQVFDPIVALTNGGPGTSTESVTMLIQRGGLTGGEFAYQTADAVVFFIVITVVSLIQFKGMGSRDTDF